jgi:AcrR family transcriptional regulator
MSDTKERILDAAEQLFAERGYAATSLRSIVAAARVNLAAIHYHFHSKEALLEAVIIRRAAPINQERLRLLAECRTAAGRKPPALEDLLQAFLAPTFRVARERAGAVRFMRLVARIHAEGDLLPAMVKSHFGPMLASYTSAFLAALPHLTFEEFFGRAHLAMGAAAQALRPPTRIEGLSAAHDPQDGEAVLQRLISFLIAGFQAPMKNTRRRNTKGEINVQSHPHHQRLRRGLGQSAAG